MKEVKVNQPIVMGGSLTELGFSGTQSNINLALEFLRFKGNSGTITIKAYETAAENILNQLSIFIM